MSATEQPPTDALYALRSVAQNSGSESTKRWISGREFRVRYAVSAPTVRRWIKKRKLTAIRIPPGVRGRVYVLDPQWITLDPGSSTDPVERLCVLRQADVARLLGITPRALRYRESSGAANYRLIGGRKLYSVSEVRRLLAQRQTGRQTVTRGERQVSLLQWARSRLESTPERHFSV